MEYLLLVLANAVTSAAMGVAIQSLSFSQSGRKNEWWWFRTSWFRSLCLPGFALCLIDCLLGCLSIARISTPLTCCPFASISDDSPRTLSTRLYANMSIRLFESLMRSSELKMWRTPVYKAMQIPNYIFPTYWNVGRGREAKTVLDKRSHHVWYNHVHDSILLITKIWKRWNAVSAI